MNTTPEPQTAISKKKRERIRMKRHSGLQRRRRKLYALLLAALIPGLGHLYLGVYRKGITFIMLLLLDISALLYFSSIGMQINVPLLIVLGLLIPIGYFYNVYDVLQAAEYMISRRRRGEAAAVSSDEGRGPNNPFRGERGIPFGLMLVAIGILLILFHQKPPWLQVVIRDYGAEFSAVVLIILGIWAAVREVLRHRKGKGKGKSL
ncbi:hypothetical protein PVOR_29828 [Paenibacillus vortex V453]|jgi:hypothetical protein|uniref:TM2 domain-containing protein n=1 Tax=Paenibacillus vortex V453 TaxID=715225 RepID=A0A2R9SMA3_9BACL|nr:MULTISPECIES: hypothetical protein [Paenibacillus]ANA79440.1 hypothetical protein A3958_05340 [Paenibacillus glucanolyticus]AVV56612.1 hypothetical protein C7121_10970 [Paenibacillus glucanolyticus]AWP25778.1 hypothetical protein B9D94_03645 [Paenibacillus sp. Cedars]EFU38507.1 hypothetical protein PVOR_29828 [Paenibacillus vortex V453]ETT31104.1 hypothetical protein C169_24703 [Paenibacillus sp. FSL R5-808]